MVITHDRARALETLRIIDPVLDNQPVPEHRLIGQIKQNGNHYSWLNGTPPEIKADLDYLHGINALQCFDGRYRRDRLTDYWLGKV